MVNQIMAGISKTLNGVFGDTFEIYYSKDVQQGLKAPCFFIALVKSSRIKQIGLRYWMENNLDVQYFPAVKGSNVEMFDVAKQLFDALELFELPNGDLVRGVKMRYEIVDGILHFFVDVNLFLLKELIIDNMEELTINAGITAGGKG